MNAHQVRQLAASLGADCIETHISWVLLAGAHAWKIKKPVELPFVDYGALEARRRCCEEEVRLNGRLAPRLYLGVDTIASTPAGPRLGGAGPVLDFAVRRRRFDQQDLFSARLAHGRVAPAELDVLALVLAAFHAAAPVAADDSGFGSPEQRLRTALGAYAGAAPWFEIAEVAGQVEEWIATQAAALAPWWQERLLAGGVREGHGDLHLENLVWLDGRPAAFDGIEFNPTLRWIDILDDIAFAVMDFDARGCRALAFRLLNGWLDRLGEHAAVHGLRFAAASRAMVRAQVMGLRGEAAQARAYAAAACTWTAPGRARLCITHGLPWSGKTWRSQAWLEGAGAIRVRSDVEPKRLAGLPALPIRARPASTSTRRR